MNHQLCIYLAKDIFHRMIGFGGFAVFRWVWEWRRGGVCQMLWSGVGGLGGGLCRLLVRLFCGFWVMGYVHLEVFLFVCYENVVNEDHRSNLHPDNILKSKSS